MQQALGFLSGLLTAISYIPYIKDILAKKTKPQRTSWFIWSIAMVIAFFSQLAQGASQSLWFTAFDAAGSVLVFTLALWFGTGGFVKRDMVVMSILSVGLALWFFTHNSLFALFGA